MRTYYGSSPIAWFCATGILVTALITAGTVSVFDRRPVLDPQSVRVHFAKESYEPGGMLTEGTFGAFFYRACQGVNYRWMEIGLPDGKRWIKPLQTRTSPVNDYPWDDHFPQAIEVPVRPFEIPADAPEGDAIIHVVAQYNCNKFGHYLWPIEVAFPPIPLKIARKEPRP